MFSTIRLGMGGPPPMGLLGGLFGPLLSAALFMMPAQAQSTLSVPSASYPTIQSALDAAVTGDTVQVAAGTYVENLVWRGQDLVLQGAGPGQSIVDGGQSGSCLSITSYASPATIIDGFTFTNGSGDPGTGSQGGGLYLSGGSPIFIRPLVRNCEITANTGAIGTAIYLATPYSVTFENIDIHSNIQNSGVPGVSGTIVLEWSARPVFRNCRVRNNIEPGYLIRADQNSNLDLKDCSVTGNSSGYALIAHLNGGYLKIIRSRLTGNAVLAPGSAQILTTSGQFARVYGSLIHGNVGGTDLIRSAAPGGPEFRISNTTIVDNTVVPVAGGLTQGIFKDAGNLNITNSIIRNNLSSGGNLLGAAIYNGTGASPNLTYSNVEGWLGGGAGVVDLAVAYVDPINGNYGPMPGAAVIDAGSPDVYAELFGFAADIRGLPRPAGAGWDMGCYEFQDFADVPAAWSRVGAGAGGPYDVLKINGSVGGPARTVTMPIGQAATVTMEQAAHLSQPAAFVIFGFFGQAGVATSVTVPLGIGEMIFAPFPMVSPWLQSYFFTLTDNYQPGTPQLMASTATPWTSPPGPVIPFPLVLSLQGVIEDGPGNYRPTNALLLKVE